MSEIYATFFSKIFVEPKESDKISSAWKERILATEATELKRLLKRVVRLGSLNSKERRLICRAIKRRMKKDIAKHMGNYVRQRLSEESFTRRVLLKTEGQ